MSKTIKIEELAERLDNCNPLFHESSSKTNAQLDRDIADAAEALRALSATIDKCKAAGFIDERGEVRKVLGTLPVTADGCVVGIGGEVHYENRQSEIVSLPIGYRFEFAGAVRWESDGLYSTREAAEAAKAKGATQ